MFRQHFQTFLFKYILVVVSNDRKFVDVWYWGTSVVLDYGKIHRRRKQSRYQRNGCRMAKNTFIIKFTLRLTIIILFANNLVNSTFSYYLIHIFNHLYFKKFLCFYLTSVFSLWLFAIIYIYEHIYMYIYRKYLSFCFQSMMKRFHHSSLLEKICNVGIFVNIFLNGQLFPI